MKHAAWGFVAAAAAVAAALALFAFSTPEDGGGPEAPPEPAADDGSATTTTGRRVGSTPRAARPAGPAPAAPSSPFGRGTAELLHLGAHGDAASATATFGRSSPGDGELIFGKDGGDEFSVRLAPDDRSVLVDLGEGTLADAAAGRVRIFVPPDARGRIPALEGHLYAVRTKDADSDRVSLFRVDGLVPADRVRVTWVDSRPAEGVPPADLQADAADFDRIGARLAAFAGRTAADAHGAREIVDGQPVILQIRGSAGDEQESRVTLDAASLWNRVTEFAERPLDVTAPPGPGEPSQGWTNCDFIPEDRAWVVEAIDVWARTSRDSRGTAAFRLLDTELFATRDDDRPFSGWWKGRLILHPGDETHATLAAGVGSAAEVRLHGRLIPRDEAKAMERIAFWPAVPPAGLTRAGGGPDSARRTNLLEHGTFSLQIAAGSLGRSEYRVTLAGCPHDSARKETAPFQIDAARRGKAPVNAWSPSVRLPRGKSLVVTRVTWRGRAAGDDEAPGGARIWVAGTVLFRTGRETQDLAGEWTGSLVVASGQEDEVLVAVGNQSALDVSFEGRLEDR